MTYEANTLSVWDTKSTAVQNLLSEMGNAARYSKETSMDVEVLIVGAGPTGSMLANQLARRGMRSLIINRHSGPAQQTRAMAVQARTLEIYSKMGLNEQHTH
ncbi:FAD-dependent monooxygenase [Nitrosomonas communis]|uniref:FAD-dependent monooxygenase n=1 Tax=Nitrosomonas communis TaxID=44574 RepID=UPI003D278F17